LALASLYDNASEESYTLYNQLIDEKKVRDSKTLLLGAVERADSFARADAIS
jgi:hypothetical protein